MGKRSRMNRANKAAAGGLSVDAEISAFLDEMRGMAQAFLDRTVTRLKAEGASDLSIVQLQNASRLLAIADVQCMDLGKLYDSVTQEDIDNGVGLTNKIVDVLMVGLIPEES